MNMEKHYTFSNKYMFSSVMRNPDICKAVLERILNREINRVEYPDYEKTIDPKNIFTKGIRIDIYCKGDDTVYSVEMQNVLDEYLPKRSRYYQSLMDSDQLEKGDFYGNLKTSFIILICRFDYYNEGRHIYTFENRCIQDVDIKKGDEVQTIILNTKGTMNDISKPLKAFLDYIETGAIDNEDYLIKEIDDSVVFNNSDKKWRNEIMTFEQELKNTAYLASKETAAQYEPRIKDMVITMIKSGIDKDTILETSKIDESLYEELAKMYKPE